VGQSSLLTWRRLFLSKWMPVVTSKVFSAATIPSLTLFSIRLGVQGGCIPLFTSSHRALTLPSGTRNCGPSAHGLGIDCKSSFEVFLLDVSTALFPPPPQSNFVLRFCLFLCIFYCAGISSYSLVVTVYMNSLSPGHSRRQYPHNGVPSTGRSVRFFS
jgi:hypothetical protein